MKLEIVLGDDAKALLAALTSAAAGKSKTDKPAKATKTAKTEEADTDADAFGDAEEADTDAEGEADTDAFGDNDGEAEGEAEETPTREAVRTALKAYADKMNSQDAAIKIMKKVGGTDRFSKLPEDKFAALIAALGKAMKAKA